MAKLEAKVAIVSGGTSGIGEAASKLFACEGAKVVVTGRSHKRGDQVVAAIQNSGRQAMFVAADLRFASECEALVQKALDQYGRVDVLFNNAGVCLPNRDILRTTEEEWDLTMDTNVKAVYLLSKAVVPHMIRQGGGVIINTASIWGLRAGTGVAAYCASKGAVVLLTRAMAVDFARQNVRVNAICPGSVDTPLLRQEMEERGGVEKAWPVFAAKHPMNAVARPEQIAEAALFLASDSASFITGASLSVDGGRAAGETVLISDDSP
ncbi:MAG: SDR family oxidoreductase [Anaerolineales bacterium]|nr:MAG: SDR family oxidoreductase [Anaerolineales bacterium]